MPIALIINPYNISIHETLYRESHSPSFMTWCTDLLKTKVQLYWKRRTGEACLEKKEQDTIHRHTHTFCQIIFLSVSGLKTCLLSYQGHAA